MIDACYTCRRRHINCDRTQTPCLKCQKAGLKCLDKRPIRWVQGVAIRGNMRGRSHQDNSVCSSPVEQVDTRSTTPVGILQQAQTFSLVDLVPTHSAQTSLPGSLNDVALSNLDRLKHYYLDYYNDRICQLLIVYDSDNNPFRSLIPLALNDAVLLDAICALAARHRANFNQPFSSTPTQASSVSPNVDGEALRFKHGAIQGLSKSLTAQRSYHDSTVASVFLLVFLDLVESGCDRWNYHLEGAKSLMALTPTHDPGRTLQRIRKFIVKQTHLIEALGATFVRPELLSKSSSIDESANLLQDVVEESFLGCPEYILTAVQFFSLQRDLIANGNRSDQASIHEVISVYDAVREFDCKTWATALPQESVTRDIDDLCKLARTYQLGAMLYGRRVLDALEQIRTNQDSVVAELVGIINSLQHGSNLLKCILWSITVAGLESESQLQRDILIQALESFWMDTKCLNVTHAAKILQAHWINIDTHKAEVSDWIFDICQLSHDWLLL
ncbi:fungal-specific transcription factor domain-containing protein [Aspergillus karnatakaensis]|uniref:Zn(II)2Cys6 transcription factor n=1 Tax=Aspergillus karnatakaensis TaxID=1810916 RepID=UPI003CCDE59E